MWNRGSRFLTARIRLSGMRPRLNLCFPIALYVPHQLILSLGPASELIPGKAGDYVRRLLDGAHLLLLGLMDGPPSTIADVNVQDGKKRVRVKVKTI